MLCICWAKLCTCLIGLYTLISSTSVANLSCYVGQSYVLALYVNTPSLVVLPSQICHAISNCASAEILVAHAVCLWFDIFQWSLWFLETLRLLVVSSLCSGTGPSDL